MPSILRNFFRNKKAEKKEKCIREREIIQERLQKDLHSWETKLVEEEKLIKSLKNHINYISDKIEDAKDTLFSEVNYQISSKECEAITKMQNQIKNKKKEYKELRKCIKNYKMEQETIRKQLSEMNLRIEENDRYKNHLFRRLEKANMMAWYQRSQIIQQRNNTAFLRPHILTNPTHTTSEVIKYYH